MQFNLTFNKPATNMFFTSGAKAIRVKTGGKGQVLFKMSEKEKGKDIFPIHTRTRGGMGITVSGRFADQFLQETKMNQGVHMALESSSYRWISGQAVDGKPSKVVPTARLWKAMDQQVAKAEDAPVKVATNTSAVKAVKAPKAAKVPRTANASKAAKVPRAAATPPAAKAPKIARAAKRAVVVKPAVQQSMTEKENEVKPNESTTDLEPTTV